MIVYFVLPFKALSVSQTHFELQSPACSLCLLHDCQPHGLETLPVHRGPLFLHWSVVSPTQRGFRGICTTTISTKTQVLNTNNEIFIFYRDKGHRSVIPHLFSPSAVWGFQPPCSQTTAAQYWLLKSWRVSKTTNFLHRNKSTNWLQTLWVKTGSVMSVVTCTGLVPSCLSWQIHSYQLALLIRLKLLQMSRFVNI